jgi:hypothetical protein
MIKPSADSDIEFEVGRHGSKEDRDNVNHGVNELGRILILSIMSGSTVLRSHLERLIHLFNGE